MGVSYLDTRMPMNVDTSRMIFFTSAILDPWTMLRIIIKALRDGFRFFILPERNLQGVLSESVLGYCRITTFARISMHLAGSGYALPLICFIIQNDDALDLITLMQLAMTSTPSSKVYKNFNNLARRTHGINLEQLVVLADKVKNGSKRIPGISKESKRYRTLMKLPDDRPLPNEYCADLGDFGDSFEKYKDFLPTILVDMDIHHNDHELYKQVGVFLSPAFKNRRIKPGYPNRFINVGNFCHMNSVFQFVSGLLVNSDCDYVNSSYPEICGIFRSYIQGESNISPMTLFLLGKRLDKDNCYMNDQQDALETFYTFFACTLISPQVPHEVECAAEWRFHSCKTTHCEKCKVDLRSPIVDMDAYLMLHVPSTQIINPLTTEALFNSYCDSAVEGRNCDICDQITGATQQVQILHTPKVLVFVTLSGRFIQYLNRDDEVRFKRVKGVVISPDLILTVHGKRFRLSSMIYHSGETPRSGHYLAAVAYSNRWHVLDDYCISSLERQTLLREYEQEGTEENPHVEYSRPCKDTTPIPSSEWAAGIPIPDGGKTSPTASNCFYVYMLGYTLLEAGSEEEKYFVEQVMEAEQKKMEMNYSKSSNKNKNKEKKKN